MSARVITGDPGTAYECPVHGRFVPSELPRYDEDQPEAKCMAPIQGTLYFGQMYCGRYCPPARTT